MTCSYCATASAVGASESCPCEDEDAGLRCEECNGPLMLLGFLGRRMHFQCRNCGAPHSMAAKHTTSED